MTVEPFDPTIDEEVIDDLRDRLRRTRWPDQIHTGGWDYGMNTEVLHSFVTTWLEDFDWSAQQNRLRRLRHVKVDVHGLGVHAVHEKARSGDGLPLLLLHGWPSSFVQMLPVIPLLTGAEQPFDVVAMSLPGYGFSDRPARRGMDVGAMAAAAVSVMEQLGYHRFAARGSDLGAGVLQQLALKQPDRLVALHLSGTNPYVGWVPDDLSEAEQEFIRSAQQWTQAEMAYAMEHSSKPQTLAHALNDSPAGLASWMLEKFWRRSDCGGDLDSVYERADLLTNLTIYWATETIGSSIRLYYETARSPPRNTDASRYQPAWRCQGRTCSPRHANGSSGSTTWSTGQIYPRAATSSNGRCQTSSPVTSNRSSRTIDEGAHIPFGRSPALA